MAVIMHLSSFGIRSFLTSQPNDSRHDLTSPARWYLLLLPYRAFCVKGRS